MRRLVGLGLVVGVMVACSAAPDQPVLVTSDVAAPTEVELYPGDADLGAPGGSDGAAMAALFPKQLRSLEECPADAPADAAAQIAMGLTMPILEQAVHGSFTRSKADQIAYVVHLNTCNTSHAENFGPTRIYVVEAGKTVAEGDGSHVNRVLDIDQDGADELVVSAGGIGQGILEENAKVLALSGGNIRVMQDFGSVLVDDCGTMLPGAASKLTRVLVTPGKGAVKFEKKVESHPCDVD
jgi:hypothetical protein